MGIITGFKTDIRPEDRALIKKQRAICLWLTGLSGAGKSTIANRLDKTLYCLGFHSYVLDGDDIRAGLNRDLGFSNEDRTENIRRASEVARLMQQSGLIVIASFISPLRSERDKARSLFAKGEFYEIFISTPLTICVERDSKGLYKRARQGLIGNLTGINSPYEAPQNPEITIDTAVIPLDKGIELILEKCGILTKCIQDQRP